MKPIKLRIRRFSIGLIFSLAASSISSASIFSLPRISLDAVVGQRQASAAARGYYDGNPPSNNRVGGTGSSAENKREGQDLIYRYALPLLNPGETVKSFTFSFQITAFRDHALNAPTLQVYLLNASRPGLAPELQDQSVQPEFFFRGELDPDHALIGQHVESAEGSSLDVALVPPVAVTFTVDAGEALDLLRSFYDGHTPLQEEVMIRFNLD